MKKDYCEEPDFEAVMFETEDSVMSTSTPVETDEDGWSIPIVKP